VRPLAEVVLDVLNNHGKPVGASDVVPVADG